MDGRALYVQGCALESNVLCSAEFSTVESIIEYSALYSFVLGSAVQSLVLWRVL